MLAGDGKLIVSECAALKLNRLYHRKAMKIIQHCSGRSKKNSRIAYYGFND